MSQTDVKELLAEITVNFPFVEIPDASQFFLLDNYERADFNLVADLASNQHEKGDIPRLLQLELHAMSPKAWIYALPYFLSYGVTPEAEYTDSEIAFLIFALSPQPEFENASAYKLSELNSKQLQCLLHFFEWCATNEYWAENYSSELEAVSKFLVRVRNDNGFS